MLRAYGKLTGDHALQERVDVQTGIRLILNLCLTNGFDMFPTLLVTDGSCMIDRRMGIHGHPLEIQVSKDSVIEASYFIPFTCFGFLLSCKKKYSNLCYIFFAQCIMASWSIIQR